MSRLDGPDEAVLAEAAEWRRLDPLMLLVHPVNELIRFFPLVIGSFFFGASASSGGPWHWIGVGLPVALGLGRFLTTQYRITAGQVELQRGLLSRRVLTAPLDRVRTVELTSSPIHRLLGLAKVRVGTGSSTRSDESTLELDSLATAHARVLRTALLHRGDRTAAGPEAAAGETAGTTPPDDLVLLRFRADWARYAPFTSSGVVSAAALFAVAAQLTGGFSVRIAGDELPDLGGLPVAGVLTLGAVVLVAFVSVLAVGGYFVTYGGFRLSADPQRRSFHVVRGLLTSREVSLEAERIRGVELHQPLGLRLVGAGRLNAIVTGLDRRSGGTSPLVPPAPRPVNEAVGADLLGDAALTLDLRPHGPAARRRRFTRALLPGLGLLVVVLATVAVAGWSGWLLVVPLVVLALALPLARDRYRRLGHALTDRYLVVRSGTFRGRRDALERSGVIGWTIRQSWFQRRVGLCDLVATTSAGKQAYTAYDVPEPVALELAHRAVPGLLDSFVRSAS